VDLASNSGLAAGATGLTVDLDTNPGLVIGAGGLAVDLASNAGLQVAATGLEVKVKTAGGITKDADGLSVSSSGGEWAYVAKNADAGVASKAFTGLDASAYDYRLIMRDMLLATSTAYVQLVIGSGETPTYQTNYYTNALVSLYDTDTPNPNVLNSSSVGYIRLSPPVDTGYLHSGTVECMQSPTGTYKVNTFDVRGASVHDDATTSVRSICGHGAGFNSGGVTTTALKIIASSGNISGTVELWRRAKN
jgi:hypothetical protein